MSSKRLLMLLGSVALVLLLGLTGCSSTPAGQSPGSVTQDKEYNVLSPRGIQPAIDISPLATRLDTVDGKTIYVNQGEPDPVIMPALWQRLNEDYPNTDWVLIASTGFGPATPEPEVLATADAVIRGIAW